MITRTASSRLKQVTEIFGGKEMTHLRQGRFRHVWLPLLLALALGVAFALLIVDDAWELLIPMTLLVPAVVLLSRYPFSAIMIYILLFPFFATRLERSVYFVLHGAMIPASLGYVLLSQRLGIKERNEHLRFGLPELAMMAFLGLAVSNILLSSSNPEQSLVRLYDRVFVPYCVYWLVRLTAPKEQDLKRLVWVAFFTVVIQVAIGLIGWYAPQVLPSRWLIRQGLRTTGTFGSPAVYSTTLMFLSVLLFQRAMQSRSGKLRAALLSVVFLGLFGVLFTFSRSSWLAGAAVLLGLALMYPKMTIRLSVPFAILVFILGNTFLADEVAWAMKRLYAEETAGDRIILLNTGLGMVKAKPLFGWGYDNYKRYDNQFKTPVGDIPVLSDSSSHNAYLTIAAELGLIAFLLYLLPVAYWLVLSLKTASRLPQRGFWSRRLLGVYWLVILALLIVSNFMNMLSNQPFGTTVWWLTLALIANMVYPLLRSGDLVTLGGGLTK